MAILYFKNFNIEKDSIQMNKEIFAFDLDNTLIEYNPKSSKHILKYPNIIAKLKLLQKKYNICIITNQKNSKPEIIIPKINKLLDEFYDSKIYVSVYCALTDDIYRKPNVGFKNIIEAEYTQKIFGYCGDALGRKNDFNDTDLKFSINIGVKIFSPEHIFLNNKNIIDVNNITYPILNSKIYDYKHDVLDKQFIIMVGYPASGKSTISYLIQEQGYLNKSTYEIISRDILQSINKCIDKCNKILKLGLNIIIDNTNPDKETRKKFILLAKKYKYKIICIKLVTNKIESIHNNYYRTLNFDSKFIPKIAYNVYDSKYDKPTIEEGFDIIFETGVNIFDINYYHYYF